MTTRLYNTHPTQGFEFYFNSADFVFQPMKGRWGMEETYIPHPTAPHRQMPKRVLVCKESDRLMRSWAEVPDDLAKLILTGPASGRNPETGQIDTRHHGGYIKEQGSLEDEIETAHRERMEKNAALDKQLAEKEQALAALQAKFQAEALEAAKKAQSAPKPPIK